VLYSDWTWLVEGPRGWVAEPQFRRPRVSENTVERLLMADQFVPFASCLVNRRWLEKVGGFDEKHWYVEDVHLMLRLALAGGSFIHVAVDFPSFCYRRRSSSLSRTNNEGFALGCYRNAKLAEAHWRETGQMVRERRLLLASIYVFCGQLAGTESLASFQRMLSGVERLLIRDAWLTTTGVRLLVRVLAYRLFGRDLATKLEGAYQRARSSLRRPTLGTAR